MNTEEELRGALGQLAELSALCAHYLLQYAKEGSNAESSALLVLWYLKDFEGLLGEGYEPPCQTCGTTDSETSHVHAFHLGRDA